MPIFHLFIFLNMIKRVFVEHKDGAQAQSLMRDIKANLKLENLSGLRVLQRYDAEGIDDADYAKLKYTIFCEAPRGKFV